MEGWREERRKRRKGLMEGGKEEGREGCVIRM